MHFADGALNSAVDGAIPRNFCRTTHPCGVMYKNEILNMSIMEPLCVIRGTLFCDPWWAVLPRPVADRTRGVHSHKFTFEIFH